MKFSRNAHLFPGYPDLHVKPFTQQVASGSLASRIAPVSAFFVLMGGATFVAQILAIEYNVALFFLTIIIAIYAIMGGLEGIMSNDATQGRIMFAGMIISSVVPTQSLAGLSSPMSSFSKKRALP